MSRPSGPEGFPPPPPSQTEITVPIPVIPPEAPAEITMEIPPVLPVEETREMPAIPARRVTWAHVALAGLRARRADKLAATVEGQADALADSAYRIDDEASDAYSGIGIEPDATQAWRRGRAMHEVQTERDRVAREVRRANAFGGIDGRVLPGPTRQAHRATRRIAEQLIDPDTAQAAFDRAEGLLVTGAPPTYDTKTWENDRRGRRRHVEDDRPNQPRTGAINPVYAMGPRVVRAIHDIHQAYADEVAANGALGLTEVATGPEGIDPRTGLPYTRTVRQMSAPRPARRTIAATPRLDAAQDSLAAARARFRTLGSPYEVAARRAGDNLTAQANRDWDTAVYVGQNAEKLRDVSDELETHAGDLQEIRQVQQERRRDMRVARGIRRRAWLARQRRQIGEQGVQLSNWATRQSRQLTNRFRRRGEPDAPEAPDQPDEGDES